MTNALLKNNVGNVLNDGNVSIRLKYKKIITFALTKIIRHQISDIVLFGRIKLTDFQKIYVNANVIENSKLELGSLVPK